MMEVMLRAGTPIPMVAQMAELSETVVRKMAEEHGFKLRRGEGGIHSNESTMESLLQLRQRSF